MVGETIDRQLAGTHGANAAVVLERICYGETMHQGHEARGRHGE